MFSTLLEVVENREDTFGMVGRRFCRVRVRATEMNAMGCSSIFQSGGVREVG